MRVIAIETSCDETSVALLRHAPGGFLVEECLIHTQVDVHAAFGGVVPEVAARLHVPVLPTLISQVNGWQREGIDAVAVTAGPGLATALRVGVETAKVLANARHLPLIPIDHIEGHIWANALVDTADAEGNDAKAEALIPCPALCLVVSGGHTEWVLMKSPGVYERLGQTRDDAAGEAFDKAAKLLGLPYPGGPSLSKAAARATLQEANALWEAPRPMLHSGDLDVSFSGLKTALRDFVANHPDRQEAHFVEQVSAAYQEAIVDVLVEKTLAAAEQSGAVSVLLCGGVAANARLRERLSEVFAGGSARLFLPTLRYTTDNAAMIGAAALMHLERGEGIVPTDRVDADPSHRLGDSWKWEATMK
jgi:N6-L-threonylcarbamoyladenine synthase